MPTEKARKSEVVEGHPIEPTGAQPEIAPPAEVLISEVAIMELGESPPVEPEALEHEDAANDKRVPKSVLSTKSRTGFVDSHCREYSSR